MGNSISLTLNWIHPALNVILPLLALLWLYRLWRKTGDQGFIWLLAALGAIPLVRYAASATWRLTRNFLGPQAAGNPADYIYQFSALMLSCMAIGCIVMALGQLDNRAVTFRDLFTSARGPSDVDKP